jgi:enhancing lycopene biosynthesis protein 2
MVLNQLQEGDSVMPRIGLILSGCGVNDGAEIHESVVALLALDRAGAEVVFLAPDKDQLDVVNHLAGEPAGEKRNVLVESARIARGNIRDVASVSSSELDGVVIPGGFGAAKNLCNFAVDGDGCVVDPAIDKLLKELQGEGKPIGAICIAPSVLARVFGPLKPVITIGTDAGTAALLEKMGAVHKNCAVGDCVVDEANGFVTTPAYMLAESIGQAAEGIEKLVAAVVKMAG